MKATEFIKELRSYAEARGLNTVEDVLQDAGRTINSDGTTAIKYLYLIHEVGKPLDMLSTGDLVDIYEVAVDNWLSHNGSPDILYKILDELSERGWPF